jgi:hypothetical protein
MIWSTVPLCEEDWNAGRQDTSAVPLEQRTPWLAFVRIRHGQEILLKRPFGALPQEDVKRTFDAFARDAVGTATLRAVRRTASV